MIEIIAFVVVVFIWDGFKKALRGKPTPTVRLRDEQDLKIVKAKCGCITIEDQVITACAAHKILLEMK